MRLQPSKLFRSTFTLKRLAGIFEEKIQESRAIGKDGTDMESFTVSFDKELLLIKNKARDGKYRFTDYREKLIPRGPNRKPRVISVPTIRDRLTHRAICEILFSVFESSIIPQPHWFIRRIRDQLEERDPENVFFLRADIKSFYDRIDHTLLTTQLRTRIKSKNLLLLIEGAIKTPTSKKNTGNKLNETGVPQGLSISNILSSIFLQDIDRKLQAKYTYFRYVDDILIICDSAEEAQLAFDEIQKLFALKALKLHPLGEPGGKTEISSLNAGIQYLGYTVQKDRISVRPASFQKMFENLLRVFTQKKYGGNKIRFMWRLNLKITGCQFDGKRYGWMFFFSQMDNISQLKRLDAFVKEQLLKINDPDLFSKVKKFSKAYFEIRHRLSDSSYIPNFDEYGQNQMKTELALSSGKPVSTYDDWPIWDVHSEFRRMIRRETRELEEDVFESFS